MKKLYKAIEITCVLLSLCLPLFIILFIWDVLTSELFEKIMFTNMILWMTFLIIGAIISKVEESENEIK